MNRPQRTWNHFLSIIPLNRPDSMSSPGDTRSYTYDALLRLDTLDSSTLEYSYSYDDVGNIVTKSTGDGTYSYEYDDLYRLTDVTNPTLDDEAYSYDAVGNRVTASDVSSSIEHNQNNELQLYGDISFEYDANGNMVSKTSASESWAYTYNVQNRLVQVEEDSLLIAEYGYDPFGRRLWKEVDGVRTYFFYSDEGLIAEYDASGVEIRSYGYKPDSTWTTDPLWLKVGSEYYWYQNDHLGTPQKLVDSSGTVVWSAQYTAFGDADVQIETVTNNLRFPGQYFDAETRLHYNWNRYYEPGTGRYTQTDPIGLAGGDVNWYVYVGNNGINAIDIMGLRDCSSNSIDAGAKRDFFNWLYQKDKFWQPDLRYPIQNLPQMAQALGIDESLLIRLAAKEPGWSNDPELPEYRKLQWNIDKNNPFGLNGGGPNFSFDSVAQAIDFWMRQPTGDITYAERIEITKIIHKYTPLHELIWPGGISMFDFADAVLCEGIWEGQCTQIYNKHKEAWRTKFYGLSPQEWKDACSEPCGLE